MLKKIFIGSAVVAAALAAGIGGAYAVSRALPEFKMNTFSQQQLDQDKALSLQLGMMNNNPRGRQYGGPGMMNRDYFPQSATLERIDIDGAVADATAYIANNGSNLQITEVMEFEENFYVVVKEKDSSKGAFELLVNPYTGQVSPEVGPNMMWNLKYGHMRLDENAEATNKISMADAANAAQKELDQYINSATIMTDGVDFYGYYSFDYEVNGRVAGMLSVNGQDGQVWLHNWHGTFIGETEVSK